MLLGFKRRFAPFVQDGSKTHTIRAKGKRRPFRVGDICDCYVDSRQKTMRLLGRWPCVKVETIVVYECGDGRFGVVVDGIELTPDEKAALAWRDGFRSGPRAEAFTEMMQFWMRTHGDGRPIEVSRVNFPVQGEPLVAKHGKALSFEGYIIHWQYEAKAQPARRQPRTLDPLADFMQRGRRAQRAVDAAVAAGSKR